ncbi:MAG: hypothetical protein M5U27_04390 [Gaiella sp.]|nr:hypothetical protein [Gaiella sp.]
MVRGGEETIERFRPRVAVVSAGGASFLEGGLIVMRSDDVREVVCVPVAVAVHPEALNRCFLTWAELAAAVPGVVIPGTARASARWTLLYGPTIRPSTVDATGELAAM